MHTDTEIRQAVELLAARAPADTVGAEILDDLETVRQQRSRARRTGAVLTAAAAVILAVIVATVPMPAGRRAVQPAVPVIPTDQRVPGNWSMTTTVTPPDGWRVFRREAYLETEQTILTPIGADETTRTCYVAVDGFTSPVPPKGTSITLGGRAGYLVSGADNEPASFVFSYASGAWVDVSCRGVTNLDASIAAVVAGFRIAHQDLRIPFTVSALPAGLTVKAIYDTSEDGGAGVDIGDVDTPDSAGPVTARLWLSDPTAVAQRFGEQARPVSVGPLEMIFADSVGLCYAGTPTICLDDQLSETGPKTPSGPSVGLQQLAADLRPAADLTDRGSWPTANAAVPR